MKAAAVDRFGPPSQLKLHELPVSRPARRGVTALQGVSALRRGPGSKVLVVLEAIR